MTYLDRCDHRRMAAVDLLLCPLPRMAECLRPDLERLVERGEASDEALRLVCELTPPPTYRREDCSILFC